MPRELYHFADGGAPAPRDWVVVFHERDGLEGRSTVITETQGTLAGRRVVRGRQRVGDQGAVVARM